MDENDISFKEITHLSFAEQIVKLAHELNTKVERKAIEERMKEMFNYENFKCFGIFYRKELIGFSNGWVTTRYYCGKQLELDNFIIDTKYRSQGIGHHFLKYIEQWGKNKKCNTIELNTYVSNIESHKFYFDKGFHILGFHFQKHI